MNLNKLLDASQAVASAGGSAKDPSTDNFVQLDGDIYFRIQDVHSMPGFFMSLSSSGNHWMFVSSEGAVTAGRECPLGAFFPYYSADKLADLKHCSGPRTIIRAQSADGTLTVWEPFSDQGASRDIQRNLYKNSAGNKLIFEETNQELGLSFRYRWTFGNRFGFIRTCKLSNLGSNSQKVSVLDGFENILPASVDDDFQNRYSNLVDAYKKNELLTETGLGVYFLNSVPSDRAEPSEGLQANVAWHFGVEAKSVLISSDQIHRFKDDGIVSQETELNLTKSCPRQMDCSREPIDWSPRATNRTFCLT